MKEYGSSFGEAICRLIVCKWSFVSDGRLFEANRIQLKPNESDHATLEPALSCELLWILNALCVEQARNHAQRSASAVSSHFCGGVAPPLPRQRLPAKSAVELQ